MSDKKKMLLPFSLTAGVLALDQVTKALIVAFLPLWNATQKAAFSLGGDFFRVIHARNKNFAFSVRLDIPEPLRSIAFMVVPLALLVFIVILYFRDKNITGAQRWAFAAVLGGGLGNLIDRVFRPEGVVDFLDFRFYGLFGFERWPTFNVADMSVVISLVFLLVSSFFMKKKKGVANEQDV